jgi:hypothetical protein
MNPMKKQAVVMSLWGLACGGLAAGCWDRGTLPLAGSVRVTIDLDFLQKDVVTCTLDAYPLGTLESRTYTVHAFAGPCFTVLGPDGVELGTMLSEADLRNRLPEVYEGIRGMLAVDGLTADNHARFEELPWQGVIGPR